MQTNPLQNIRNLVHKLIRSVYPIMTLPQKYTKVGNKKTWYYKIYLNSPHWGFMKANRLKKDNFICRVCGEGDKLHVHHLTYCRIGREKLRDLVTLCENCHEKAHFTNKGEKLKLNKRSLLGRYSELKTN